jgi:energy-coupling factor transporter ATP-binding protein EcfA2
MNNYDFIKATQNLYAPVGFDKNPFSITPLFRSFKSLVECQKDEKLFVLSEALAREINILSRTDNKRVLVYGHYGVGKTSLVDFIMYIAYHYRHKFCVRLIINEDNIQQAIGEILLNICQEILSELASKKISQPFSALKKWVAEHHYADLLLESMLKLMGSYQETSDEVKVKTKKTSLGLAPSGIGINRAYEQEIHLRKTIQSYVQVLPMRKTIEYLELFYEIIQRLGFQEIVVFIDEADHLENIDRFLGWLTKARELLFAKGYSFFVCGSLEIAKFAEAMGAIFDKLLLIPPADQILFHEILEARIQSINPNCGLLDLFETDALAMLYQVSNGVQKHFIRMAENALDLAVSMGARKISQHHCLQIVESNKDSVSINLSDIQFAVMDYLGHNGARSSSDSQFQDAVHISRAQLRNILDELFAGGYLYKEKKGRKNYYTITSRYLPYFAGSLYARTTNGARQIKA